MAELKYTTRSIRQRGAKEMWGITLSHKNPITGETVRTYHKVEAKDPQASREEARRADLGPEAQERGQGSSSIL